MAYVLLGRATCERHGISNTLIPGLPPLSSSRRQRKGLPLLCQVLCLWHSALLLLGFGSGGLRKQAASLFWDRHFTESKNFFQRIKFHVGGYAAIMSTVSLPEMLLRIGLAFTAGLIVGWERTSHGRAAGLRTTILACVASAMAMVISEALFAESVAATAGGNWRPDPARLGAGILTGIGFLGAGTIIRHENAIRGVTTAATLWFVTVVGLAFGSGQFAVGFLGMAVAIAALFILPSLEQVIQSDWYATLTVTGTLEALSETTLRNQIESSELEVKAVRYSSDLEEKQKTLVYELKLKKSAVFQLSSKLMNQLTALPGVLQVKWD